MRDRTPLTAEQEAAVAHVLELFDGDYHRICEEMGMTWDGNMGWND